MCLEERNFGCHIVLGPLSHGSMRIVNVPESCWWYGDGGSWSLGAKVRRKVVSPFRCLMFRDMAYSGWLAPM